jgi:hypothetical protein
MNHPQLVALTLIAVVTLAGMVVYGLLRLYAA